MAKIWAVLKAVWCFTRSLVVEEKRETEQQNGGRCRVKKEFFRGYSLTVILLLALWILDPIGVASNSARASAALFYRIISPSYEAPTRQKNAGSLDMRHDDTQIAVIVINDATLQGWAALRGEEVYWPPPFSVHDTIIKKILLYNPKALFIDIGFFDERQDGSLADFVETLEERFGELVSTKTACAHLFRKSVGCHPDDGKIKRKVPIILAGAPRPFERREEPYKLEVIPALKSAVSGTASTRYSTAHELPYNGYPLYDCFTGEPSAALAMYAAYRDDWTTWGLDRTPCRSQAQREARDWAGGVNIMSVYWASWGSEHHSRGSYRCRTLPETSIGRLAQVVEIWIRGLFQDDMAWRDQFQACPPHRSYAAHAFLADDRPELAEFMDGRYVFYGANFTMADDLITPPTHEPVPGVFLHAMALDNLFRLGDGFLRLEGGTGLGSATSWLTFLAILLVSLFTVLAWTGFEALVERPATPTASGATPKTPPLCWSKAETVWDRLRPIGRYLIGVAWISVTLSGLILCVLTIVYFCFSFWHLAPFDFVGILSFVGIHTVVRTSYGLLTGIAGGA